MDRTSISSLSIEVGNWKDLGEEGEAMGCSSSRDYTGQITELQRCDESHPVYGEPLLQEKVPHDES